MLREGYGLTEAVTAQSANPLHGLEKPGSIGIPFPDVQFRIVDMETGTRELIKDQVGELTIKSPCLMNGYHNRPAETARALRDGWLFTSDIAWMDSDGYFYVIDRKKDIVIAGAFKAYPAEVEALLATNPKIKEAAVLGTFDDISGHSLKAFVVLHEGQRMPEEEVIKYCRENLSDYKVPHSVEFVDSLPRSSMGKILRRELESD
jgi:long-chain acyl-CoA synthetase